MNLQCWFRPPGLPSQRFALPLSFSIHSGVLHSNQRVFKGTTSLYWLQILIILLNSRDWLFLFCFQDSCNSTLYCQLQWSCVPPVPRCNYIFICVSLYACTNTHPTHTTKACTKNNIRIWLKACPDLFFF